jgi:type I restriction-modification system DNA methylase subunit
MKNLPRVDQVIAHCRELDYMIGVERDQIRVKETQEVFTPTSMVQEVLDQLPQEMFADPAQKIIDNSCGDGQFLSEALIRKVESGIDFETALASIYGVDMMQDNVDFCRRRLLCGQEHLRHIVEKNIVCNDALTYKYKFPNVDADKLAKKESTTRTKQHKELMQKKLFGEQIPTESTT